MDNSDLVTAGGHQAISFQCACLSRLYTNSPAQKALLGCRSTTSRVKLCSSHNTTHNAEGTSTDTRGPPALPRSRG